ncbi:hypothetical protein GPEL0_01f2615 [Geoanaerobacter pelophilus]|uniref:Uncharacterized protein n=1 Tax=Geoanaerobacter pelophilus TaxID=60036 RepID=A0ABQ0MIV0_9BACT|nr:hypothetical protein GPEL0_01f2615 [Geoanaerobacter pelophilus]
MVLNSAGGFKDDQLRVKGFQPASELAAGSFVVGHAELSTARQDRDLDPVFADINTDGNFDHV